MPVPLVAETGQTIVSPPQSSGVRLVLLKLFLHPVDVRAGKIDLVDRDHDLHVRRGLGVIDRLDCLRHDAVIGRDDEHDDVGHIGAARAHGGEGGVARSVEESDRRAIVIDAVSADVLRDSAGFARRDARLANRVHERGLAVIDMAHEGDDGAARLEFLFLLNDRRWRRDDDLFDLVNAGAFFAALLFENEAVALRDLRRDVGLDRLVEVGENVEASSALR